MLAAASASSDLDETDPLEGWERTLLDRQLDALGRLAEMGMALAAAITQRATAPEPLSEADLRSAPLDFARVSRAVRLTFALQSQLIADFKQGSRQAGGAADDDGPIEVLWRGDIVDRDEVQQRQVEGVVERLAKAASLEHESVERLVSEARERLEDDDFYRDLTRRPIGEIIALICRDLGLEPDWASVCDEWWAKAEINHPPLGSPFAGWKAGQVQAPSIVPSG